MNRAQRLIAILDDGLPHCSRDLYRQLPGFPARAVNEAKRSGQRIEHVGTCHDHDHGGVAYAVYRLNRTPQQLTILGA
jgi:hypothetical protein